MDAKKIMVLATVALLLACVGIFLNEKIKEAKAHPTGNTLYVGGTGSHNYSTIQEALNDAADNYTIYIYAGVYSEHLTISTKVTVIGESAVNTIIEGEKNGTALSVLCSGVSVDSLRFRYAGGKSDDALLYAPTHDLTVHNCIFEYARHGMLLPTATATTIHNCTFYRTAIGIRAQQSSQLLLDQCTFIKNGIGILASTSTSLTLHKIYGELNGVTIMTENCEHVYITECLLLNGNENQVNLYAELTTNITVDHCTIYHSGRGIRLSECSLATINNSCIFDSKIGIETSTISHIRIENSELYENDIGIYLHNSEEVTILKNAIHDNYVANLAAEDSSADARHNWWGHPLTGQTTIHMRGGRILTFPWLKENPPRPTDTSAHNKRSYPLQPEQPELIIPRTK